MGAALCCISPKLLFVCNRTNKLWMSSYSVFFILFATANVSLPICLLYICHYFMIPYCGAKPYLPYFSFRLPPLQRLVSCYTFLSASFPPLYICYSLHPAIRILLTLACLIRVRQGKIKTKASPFFFPASLHMSSPSFQRL